MHFRIHSASQTKPIQFPPNQKDIVMRTTLLIVAALAGFALAGCDETTMNPTTTTTTPVPGATNDSGTNTDGTMPSTAPDTTSGVTTGDTTPAPDNTGRNERDAAGNTKTPIDQDENQADVTTTAEIRKMITGDSSMSINARNVKIVTSQGKVTLRGPVDSATEKEAVEKFARDVAGETNVTSEIEVVQP
jgi:hyperosmotically inducible periplasmic protein